MVDRQGAFMEPTILAGVTPGNPSFRDEFFGPVAMVFRVRGEDAAIGIRSWRGSDRSRVACGKEWLRMLAVIFPASFDRREVRIA